MFERHHACWNFASSDGFTWNEIFMKLALRRLIEVEEKETRIISTGKVMAALEIC